MNTVIDMVPQPNGYESRRSFIEDRGEGAEKSGGRPMNNAIILLVDDESQIRRVLQASLSSNGYDVIEARNGKEAITGVLREHPDLILLDLNMLAMSGFEAYSKIRMSFDDPTPTLTWFFSEIIDESIRFDRHYFPTLKKWLTRNFDCISSLTSR
jgi:PleD family two-component response regulator